MNRVSSIVAPASKVVVLHGFMGSTRSMEPLTNRLATHFEVLPLDITGHGEAEVPANVEAYEMSAVVATLAAKIGDAANGQPVTLVGYSMGGRVALSLAVARPDLVGRLVLIGASPGIADDDERRLRRERDDVLAQRLVTDGLESFVDAWLALPMFASLQNLGGAWQAEDRRRRLQNDPAGLANSLRGTGTGSMPPLHQNLRDLDLPTLVIAGSLDAKYAKIGAQMVSAFPDAQLVTIVNAGHAAHVESPASVAGAITAFLRCS